MKIRLVIAAAVIATCAVPQPASAATGTFRWSDTSTGVQSHILTDPVPGHCYALVGVEAPFYAVNTTDKTVRYYKGGKCKRELGSIPAGMFGHVTRHVMFDA
ncbi:hypothetical protein GCM10027589_41910 [Actinocorallia lasiicapitis]